MATKIYWPIGLTRDMPGRSDRGALFERRLNDYCRHLFRDTGTTVGIAWMSKTTGVLNSLYLGMINEVHLVRDILDAEKEGYNAATVGGHWDPALWAAREAATIPVVGPGEAAMMVAGLTGGKFAFLTVDEGYVPVIDRNIILYGFERKAISRRPVRRFGMSFDNLVRALEGEPDEFLTAFEIAARDCIADGADVIIAGGQLFGPVFLDNQYFSIPNAGVPVIEVSACALKLAETMATLKDKIGLGKSEHMHSPFRTPDRAVLEDVRQRFDL